MKSKLLFFGLLIFFSAFASSQHVRSNNNKVQFLGSIGFGVGRENLISLPKLSGLVSFKLCKRNNSNQRHPQQYAYYFGTETSILVFFAGAFSISGTTGIKTGPITADCSLTRLFLANPDGNIVARQTTLNPKIGAMIGPVWVKTGPSFLMTDQDIFGETFGNFMPIGQIVFNFEVNYFLTR